MYKLYKDGEEASCEREQLALMKKAGWSETVPAAEVVPELTPEELAAKEEADAKEKAAADAAAAKQQAKEDAASAKGKGKI